MRNLLKKLFLSVALAVFVMSRSAFAMPEIMSLDKIENGMKGVAYTVVDNSGVIEPFDVEIMGIMDNGKGSAKMIVAKASGEVVDKTGGILQGMSGSPVYIDGKLIGALSAGLKEMNPYIFFITPIENMLKIWEMPDTKAIKFVKKPKPTETKTDEQATFFFSGFDSNGLKFLERELEPLGFTNFYAASNSRLHNPIKYNAKLEPGSAFGVAVVCGDFLVGATGTVTAIDGKKILGFGHPFTHAGNVNFFMMDSDVIAAVSGENGNGIKLASVGNIIGRINQDRESGVAGVLGKFPSTIPITVNIKNVSSGKVETYRAKIAYNETLVPKLGTAIAYTALSKTFDSLAESTVTVEFKIETNAVESGVYSRKNMYYSPSDVGQVAMVELLQALNVLCANTTEITEIYSIEVNVEMESERRTATLVSAKPNKELVKPGETVYLEMTVQPYRRREEKFTIPYTVPISRREGPLVLDIHGGALVPVAQASGGGIQPSTGTPAQNFQNQLNKLLSATKNNQLILELNPTPALKTDKERKREAKRLKNLQKQIIELGIKIPTTTNRFDIGYIIDNVIQVTVNVDKFDGNINRKD